MLKKIAFLVLLTAAINAVQAQEVQARLTVMSSKINSQVNKSVFQTLQTALTNFINNRKWTNDVFQSNEKIQCNFLITIESAEPNNVYRGKLTVQAARPIYNTTYDSPI